MFTKHKKYFIASIFVPFLAAQSYSFSTTALSLVGIVNTANTGMGIYSLDSHSSSGAVVSATDQRSFQGRDGDGNQQTMSIDGTTITSSQFGRLRSYTRMKVDNTYYNASNPMAQLPTGGFDPLGSPDTVVSLGFAWFEDTLQFGGQLQAGYRARYYFHVDGTNTGIGSAADLAVNIAGNNEGFFAFNQGSYNTTWVTQSYEINGITPQEIRVQFSTQANIDLFNVADGSNLDTISNFSSTATLAGIEVMDANGHTVQGWTVQSASGTAYTTVPEPTTLAMLTLAAVAALKRKRMPKN